MAAAPGARLDERTTGPAPKGATEPRLLTVSAAARLLGVSSSSLRAWAAAGRVPHVRTPGRSPPLRARRAGALAVRARRRAARAAAAAAGARADPRGGDARDRPRPGRAPATRCSRAFEEELARTRPSGASRPSAARQTRVLGALEALAGALDTGDLAGALPRRRVGGLPARRLRAAGRRAGHRGPGPAARGQPGARADPSPPGPPSGAPWSGSLDRMAVRVAAGYADGVRCRLRSHARVTCGSGASVTRIGGRAHPLRGPLAVGLRRGARARA